MIPIIYESSETIFSSNGLGRLRDCLSCVCYEEKNGIYELDFSYPVDGANFDLIQCGRIVAVMHNKTGDVQPFDIVSYSKPLNGIVEFHAVHISYRQSGLVAQGTNINSLADAFAMLENAEPENPFTYETDFSSSAYMAAADGVPRSVRQFLGGIEGSILDAYGGEFEFDKFRVILHQNRGQTRDFSIRYGVNMIDYNDETDYSGTYSSCIPYWTGNDGGSDVVVTGNRVDIGSPAYNGRNICAALDLTERFEDKPTTSQLESMALSLMRSKQTTLPAQTITVDFVRLQDFGYDWLDNLLECDLCDTIGVVFPRYNMVGRFKIVRVEWDVLAERYNSMELGALSMSLAEALGITSTADSLNKINDLAIGGDLVVGGTADVVGDLSAGGLISNYGSAAGMGGYRVDRLYIKVARPTNTVTLTTSYARIPCATNVFGTNTWMTLNSNGTITINADCYIVAWAHIYITGTTAQDAIYIALRRDGSTVGNQYYRAASSSDTITLMPIPTSCSAGDVIDIAMRNATAARGVVQNSTFTNFIVQIVAPN